MPSKSDDDELFLCMVDRRKALFPAETIVRDTHSHESPTRCEQVMLRYVCCILFFNHGQNFFILPKLYLKKSIKKRLKFSNSIFGYVWKIE